MPLTRHVEFQLMVRHAVDLDVDEQQVSKTIYLLTYFVTLSLGSTGIAGGTLGHFTSTSSTG
jgi:hypothetical protein